MSTVALARVSSARPTSLAPTTNVTLRDRKLAAPGFERMSRTVPVRVSMRNSCLTSTPDGVDGSELVAIGSMKYVMLPIAEFVLPLMNAIVRITVDSARPSASTAPLLNHQKLSKLF